jgi:hypothetical protein
MLNTEWSKIADVIVGIRRAARRPSISDPLRAKPDGGRGTSTVSEAIRPTR